MVILGVYESDFQALSHGLSHACSSANAHSQSATGKDLPKSSSIKKITIYAILPVKLSRPVRLPAALHAAC